MKIKNIFIGLIFLLIVFLPAAALAQEITVAAAANVQYPLGELKAEFEKNTDIKLKTIIGSSGKLTAQIENGAPFDIFISADMEYPETLHKEGLTYRPPRIYAYGVLVLWTLKDLDLSKGMEVLTDPAVKKVALANPKTAPYGRQAVNAMKHYKLYEETQPKLVYGESIAQVNQFITTQALDLGFSAKSVVLAPNLKEKGKWVEVDASAYSPIAQGVVI
ncbi:MAG TPA: molybdate ABC transporter substrate-binding protein, partial [Candidatus Omnitrophota bacterium]|nr:molybdate ABC transporter substrate-binding protein [Candidatus Omnitrophota bacterium]